MLAQTGLAQAPSQRDIILHSGGQYGPYHCHRPQPHATAKGTTTVLGTGGLHQRRGQAPSTGNFSDWFLINSSAISAAQNAYSQAVIFEVTKAIRTALDQLHFPMKTFCDAVIPRKTEHPGHFFAPIMQRLAQGAQRREGSFSKLINFIQQFSHISTARIDTLRPNTQ
jgi:hypothetical protein